MLMKTPLFDAIVDYQSKNPARFHTPGISGCNLYSPLYDFAPFDITELSFSDNLENPEGVILSAEKLYSEVYKAKRSLFFTSGATVAIYCALYVLKSFGKTILAHRNCHKSVYSASKVLGLNLISFQDNDNIDKLLKDNTVSGIIITSPDYFGKCVDIEKLSKITRKHNKLLIVDEAHGSHFVFSTLFPKSATNFADMVIEGCHKTMPVQTGGCVLNICNEELINTALIARKLINTTSPSYLTLATLDYARAYLQRNGENLYLKVKEAIEDFKKTLKSPFEVIKYDDFTRLNILTGDYSAYELNTRLQSFNIYAEMSVDNVITFIITPFNYLRLKELSDALSKITLTEKRIKLPQFKLQQAQKINFDNIDFLPIEKCCGKVCMSEIGIYPPGSVIIKTGDILNKEIIDYLFLNKEHLFGLVNDLLPISNS